MSGDHRDLDPPKPLLLAVGFLIVGSLLLAYWGRQTGIGRTQVEQSAIVAQHELRLLPQGDGTIGVYLTDGSLVQLLPIEQAGFVSGVLRGFSRGRSLAKIPADVPFALIRYADGQLVLEDTATRERVVLDVFGPTNAKTFVDLWLRSQNLVDARRAHPLTDDDHRLASLAGGH